MSDEFTPISATELYEGTLFHRKALHDKSKEDRVKSWLKWFKRNIERLCTDAISKGLLSCLIDLPFQPSRSEEKLFVGELKYKGQALRMIVKELMPGCEVEYVEVECDYEEPRVVFEISWDLKNDY